MEALLPLLCLESVDQQESVLKRKAFGSISHRQVCRCKSGRDYSKRRGGGGCVAGGQGKLEQLLINMHALSLFFLSVEEEEDEEMAEVKPGLESEQQDEDESRETKEGRIPDGGMRPRSSLLSSSFMLSVKHHHSCVSPHAARSRIRWGGGVIAGPSYQPSGMLGSALIKNLSLDPS